MKRDTVPELHVERLRLGELSELEAARVRGRLAVADELHRLDVPPEPGFERLPDDLRLRIERAADRERARLEARRRHASHGWSLAVTAASFAVMAVVFAMPRAGLRDKGGAPPPSALPALVVHRQTRDGHEALGDGARVRPGDVLQLAYRPGRAEAGQEIAIFSIDGRGLVTTHIPPTRVDGPAERRLPTAFQLDDAPAFERFLLLAAPDVDEAEAMAALVALGRRPDARTAPLDGPWRVVSVTLDKGPP